MGDSTLSDQGYDSSFGAGARVGWLGHLTRYLALGATWQSKTSMGKLTKYAGLFADHGGFDIPATYGVGLALTPMEAWTVALDWQKIEYADVAAIGDGIQSLFGGTPLGASWRPTAQDEISGSVLHAFRKTVNGFESLPQAFGGGEANLALQETSIGVSWSHHL